MLLQLLADGGLTAVQVDLRPGQSGGLPTTQAAQRDQVVAGVERVAGDAAPELRGLAELARAIGAEPASIRRLFASGNSNPTLGTLAEVASALGMQVTLTPLPAAERRKVTQPLLQGRAADPKALAEHLVAIRGGSLASATR